AGHRLSTAEMEEVISSHNTVAECAVFGIHDEIKGQTPLALVVTKAGNDVSESVIEQEVIAKIRSNIGTIATLKRVIVVDRLPKTRSGKILRKLLRDIADKKEYTIPSTIDDPEIINEIIQVYKQHKI
ncbi:MAG: propionyl-CoA synthetase, partial [Myroides sp.]